MPGIISGAAGSALSLGIELRGAQRFIRDSNLTTQTYLTNLRKITRGAGRTGAVGLPGVGTMSQAQYTSFVRQQTRAGGGVVGGVGGGGARGVTPRGQLGPSADDNKRSKEHVKTVKEMGMGYAKLAIRAMAVIPIWMALRSVYIGIINVVKSIVMVHTELDKHMRRVMAVTQETGDAQKKTYAVLEQRAKQYFATSAAGMKDITEAMYQIGTAGRSTEEIMQGFEHVLNLSIGTYGNVAQAGQIVAGILNVFEKQLRSVGNTETQIQYITDLLAVAWKNNQVELKEMQQAMTYLGSVGGALNIELKDLIASASVMSDAMLRGGKGGRLLARSLIQVSKSTGKLKELGVVFDPYKPLQYRNLMLQLHDIYEEQGQSLNMLETFIDIFGTRGGRAVFNLMQQWEKFNEEINRTPEEIKGTAAALKELAEKSWPAILKRLWQGMITRDVGVGTGSSWQKEFIAGFSIRKAELNKIAVEISSSIDKIAASYRRLTEEEAIALGAFLASRKQFGAATAIGAMYGVEKDIKRKRVSPEWVDKGKKVAEDFIEWKKKQVKEQEKLEETASGFTMQQQKALDLVKESSKYEDLRLAGLDKSVIAYRKISDEVEIQNKINTENVRKRKESIKDIQESNKSEEEKTRLIEAQKEILKTALKSYININDLINQDEDALRRSNVAYKEMLKYFKMVETYQKAIGAETRELNSNELKRLDINSKIAIAKAEDVMTTQELIAYQISLWQASGNVLTVSEKQKKILLLQKDAIVELKKEMAEYAETIKGSVSEGLKSLLTGETGLGDLFAGIGDTFREEMMGATAEGLTDLIFDDTGLGKIFGAQMAGMKRFFSGKGGLLGAFEKGKFLLSDGIVDGAVKAKAILSGGPGAGTVGWTGSRGGGFTLPGFGPGGWMNQSFGGDRQVGTRTVNGKQVPIMLSETRQRGLTRGQVGGLAVGGILTGYSQFQAMKAAGMEPGMAAVSGIGMGAGGAMFAGSLAAQAASGAAAMGPVGWIGLALMAIGMAAGIFGKKGGLQTSMVEKTAENKVASKIDVTNKNLEIINRNLVAMRSDLTYILPASAYFAEKRGIDDIFALNSTRGLNQ